MRISVDELSKAIETAVSDYIGVTEEAAAKGCKETADKACEELHTATPPGAERYGSWDAYNNDWMVTEDKKKKRGVSYIVHNRNHYRLAHLLEKGHAIKGGGRARAFPHIAPIANKAEEELLDNIKKNIE
jgi:hypothetical protein